MCRWFYKHLVLQASPPVVAASQKGIELIVKRRLTFMQKLRRFGVLSEASLLLAISRFLILFVPFHIWRISIGIGPGSTPANKETDNFDDAVIVRAKAIGRQVRGAASRVPFKAVCLPQAMAARWMLARRGIRTQLFIGAKSGDAIKSHAFHAWLMLGDICLTGQDEMEQFKAFAKAGRNVTSTEKMPDDES